MNLGPKMEFILRVYQMTEAENEFDLERDRAMLKFGAISERDFQNRSCTRNVARYYRARDDAAGPPWMKPACRPEDYDDPQQAWEALWPMYRQTTATPLWATDKFGVWGPERKIAYEPYPRADEAIFGFGYDDEPPEPAL
jgi:hypothetical protein